MTTESPGSPQDQFLQELRRTVRGSWICAANEALIHQRRYRTIDRVRDGAQQFEFSRTNRAVSGDRVSAGAQEKLFHLWRRLRKLIERGFDGSQRALRKRQKSEVRAIGLQMFDAPLKRGLRLLRQVLSRVSQAGEQGRTGGGYSVDGEIPNFGLRHRLEVRRQVPAQHLLQGELEQVHLLISRDQLRNVRHERGVLRQRQPAQRGKRQVNQRNFDEFIQLADGGQNRIDLQRHFRV